MISLGSRLIACCKLAPTLARQMWRHNYVIDRNEYLIFTLSESISPWVYSLQFCNFSLNPQIIHGDMKENVNGCFFWTQCTYIFQQYIQYTGCLTTLSRPIGVNVTHDPMYVPRPISILVWNGPWTFSTPKPGVFRPSNPVVSRAKIFW